MQKGAYFLCIGKMSATKQFPDLLEERSRTSANKDIRFMKYSEDCPKREYFWGKDEAEGGNANGNGNDGDDGTGGGGGAGGGDGDDGGSGADGGSDGSNGSGKSKRCRFSRWLFGEPDEDRLIMAPPVYADLGKDARNIFNKGYHFGLIKLDCKTKTNSGVEFSSGGYSNQDSGKVFGSLETKYGIKEYGLTFSERWNTDNTLGTEVSIQNYLAQGLKVGLDSSFAPQTGSKSAKLKSEFKNDLCAVNCDVDLDMSGPNISAAAVLGYNGWLAGYQTGYDTQNSKITKNNFALGYSTGDFILHTNVNDGQEFGGSIFQKVNPKLETGIQLSWTSGSNETRFGIGCKYDLDRESTVRAKVNNSSQIGIGYTQKVRDGITVHLSAMIDGKNFNQGGHKIGVALELEA